MWPATTTSGRVASDDDDRTTPPVPHGVSTQARVRAYPADRPQLIPSSAGLAASVFYFGTFTVPQTKQFLTARDILVRQ